MISVYLLLDFYKYSHDYNQKESALMVLFASPLLTFIT